MHVGTRARQHTHTHTHTHKGCGPTGQIWESYHTYITHCARSVQEGNQNSRRPEEPHSNLYQARDDEPCIQSRDKRSRLFTRSGSLVKQRRLLMEGFSVVEQNRNGWTALMLACDNRHRVVVEKLPGKGAGMDMQSMNATTALMIASEKRHGVIMR